MGLQNPNFKSELCCKQNALKTKGQMGDLIFNYDFPSQVNM